MPGAVTLTAGAAHKDSMNLNDERWLVRYEALADCVEERGRFPRRTVDSERSLYMWLNDQRRFHRAGTLARHRAERLAVIPGALIEKRRNRIEELADFYARNGRLPKTTSPDPEEANLAVYMVQGLRTSIRRGTISSERLARVKQIPGAADVRPVPDQDAMVGKLEAWVAENGRMPVRTVVSGSEENRLCDWVRNTCAGDPETKTERRRRRHLAVEAIAAAVPPPVPAESLHLDGIEAFCTEHGHLPRNIDDEEAMAVRLAVLRRRYEDGELDRFTSERVKRVLRYPNRIDFLWAANLKAMKIFVAENGGLPTSPSQGRLYTWLTVQRRSWRDGSITDERIVKLCAVPGILPPEAGAWAA